MLFSLLKHYLDLYISDTALKVSQSLYCFPTSLCHGVENYFPRLWGTCISDPIFICVIAQFKLSGTSLPSIKQSQGSFGVSFKLNCGQLAHF